MRFSYRNEFPDYMKHYELLNGSAYPRLRSSHYASLLLPVGIGVLGAMGTYSHTPALSALIIAGVIFYLVQAVPYRKIYDRSVGQAMRTRPEKDIILEIKNDGLVETVDGIESFCPWPSIKYFQIFQGDLFISLKANLWATVPARYLTAPDASMSELLNTLRAHNINEKS
jgi:hypothetical protein